MESQTLVSYGYEPSAGPLPPPPIMQPRHRRRWHVWVGVGALVVAAAGLGLYFGIHGAGSGSPLSAPSPPSTASFMATGQQAAVFLQWRQSGDQLTGTAQVAIAEGTPPNADVSSDTIPFTGTLDGSSITLSFNGAPASFGTVAGGSFTLDVPTSSGVLTPERFAPAAPATFDAALASLRRDVDKANQIASQQAQLGTEQQAITQAAQTVEGDMSGLSSAGSQAIGDAQALQEDVQAVANDLTTTQSDLQQTYSDAAQGGSAGPGVVCADAGTVAGDAGTTSGDAGSLSGDLERGVGSDLQSITQGIASLQSDYGTLQHAESQLPRSLWPPGPIPGQSDVSQAINQANGATSQASSIANGFIDQTNNDVGSAFGDVAQAYQAGNCGPSPPGPPPIAHVSP